MSYVGSLSSLDTNIGEMKNYQIKQFSQKANQTKNTLKTIAVRESQRFSFNDITTLCKNIPVPANNVSFDDLHENLTHFCLTNGLNSDSFDFFTKTVYLGCTFRSSHNCSIIYQQNMTPFMGVIQAIAYQKNSENVFFIVKKITLSILPNLCLRECKITDNYAVVNIDHLIYERPIFLYKCLFPENLSKLVVCTWCD